MIVGGETREELIAIIDKQQRKVQRGLRDLDWIATLLAGGKFDSDYIRHRVLEASDRLGGGAR